MSYVNLIIGFCLLLFILVVGPTSFLLKTSLNSVGVLMQNFVQMTFWTDPFTESSFVEDWTVFYWAWWIAFAPYVGMFIARISQGRTIQQVIVGMLVFGSLGCWVFYMVIGNYSLFLELEGIVSITGVLNEQSQSAAIVATLRELPLPGLVIAVFAIMAIIFATTTYDSAAYTIASSATHNLPAGSDPARWHRVFWAFAIGGYAYYALVHRWFEGYAAGLVNSVCPNLNRWGYYVRVPCALATTTTSLTKSVITTLFHALIHISY